jgi:hypothetical protein
VPGRITNDNQNSPADLLMTSASLSGELIINYAQHQKLLHEYQIGFLINQAHLEMVKSGDLLYL